MGLLTDIGEKFSNTIKAGIASAANSMAELSNSFVYSGGAIVNTGVSTNGLNSFNTLSDETYFEYLKNYHFVSAVLEILTSCVKDALIKSDFHCTIVGDDTHTDKANNLIDDLQLKQFVLDNLEQFIYRGIYAFGIDYQRRKLYALNNPYDCNIMTNTRDIIGYEVCGNIISNENLVAYYYDTSFEEAIGDSDTTTNPYSAIKNKTDINSDIPEELQGLIVKFKKYKPKGLFNGKLFRIFQLYSLECALYYLGLRESMKPTLLSMSTGGRQINVNNAIDMSVRVEGLLNEPVTGLAQLSDPVVYMNQLVWTMLNNVKVVPAIEEYNNISDINAGDVASRRDKLTQELDTIRKEILQELTIPEQLFGGDANRWEQYSRSDRFMTTIDSINESISRMMKQIVCKYTGISTVSISFNIDTSSLTASFDTKSKLSNITEKFADIGRLLGSIGDMTDNEFVVKTKMYDYVRDQIKAIDNKLGDVLIARLEQEGEENDDSSEDMGDFE